MHFLTHLFGQAGRTLVRMAARVYYRPIAIQNAERIPPQGALLVAANHPNSLLDPILVGLTLRRPVHFLAKAPLFTIPVFGSLMRALGMIPAFRKQDDASEVKNNMASLQEGVQVLKRSEVLGIFPEGKSHDEIKVDQVKSGAARMAVDAYEKGMTRLIVLPVGLNYEQKDRFRSAVWVAVGEPIQMHEWMQSASTDSRQAMRELSREIDRSLKLVVVHLEDTGRTELLADLDALLQDAKNPVTGILRRKNIADALNHFLGEKTPAAEDLAGRVTAFSNELRSKGLRADFPVFRKSTAALLAQLLAETLGFFIGFGTALAGTIYYAVPYGTVRLLSLRLNAPGNMTTATTRLCLSLPHYVVWAVFVWFGLRFYFLPWIAWTVTLSMPLAGVIALSYWPALFRKSKSWFRQLQLLSHKPRLTNLRRQHTGLRNELLALDATFSKTRSTPAFPAPQILPGWWTPARIGFATAILLALASLYVFRAAPKSAPMVLSPASAPDLALIANPFLEEQLLGDEHAFLNVLKGLQQLRDSSGKLEAEFQNGTRSFYRQEDNDAIRSQLLSYLNYRNALLRLIWRYQNSDQLKEPVLRGRAELLHYAAKAVLFESSVRFIDRYAGRSEIIRKLNEGEPQWNVPPDLYDTTRRNLARPENRTELSVDWNTYLAREKDYQALGLWTGTPYDEIHTSIRSAARGITAFSRSLWPEELNLLVHDVIQVGQSSQYQTGSVVSSWIGDTKIRAPRDGKPLIQADQLEVLRSKLQPGDIILERRNWFLSNAFLPGYWPHSALYIGTPEQLEKMGLKEDDRVKKAWDDFRKPDAGGHTHVILESVSEGVVFSSLEHSIGGADSVAILRPRLMNYQTKEAISRAFGHYGKPYDFDFDFFSTDKLVCTELLFRSYDGYLNFELVDILGRKTLPALEIVRAFEKETKEKKPKLEFVAFLDGDEAAGKASFSDEAALLGTLNRPALTWLQAFSK